MCVNDFTRHSANRRLTAYGTLQLQGEEQLGAQAQYDHDLAALHRMAERATAFDKELEPDNAFTCRLTMEVVLPLSKMILGA